MALIETGKRNKTLLTFLCPAEAADLSVNSQTVYYLRVQTHRRSVEKRDFTGLPSCAKEVRTIAFSFRHNVTSAQWLCCFWHPLFAPRKFHDFLCDGLKMGCNVGFKGLDCVVAVSHSVQMNVDFTLDTMKLELFSHYQFYHI